MKTISFKKTKVVKYSLSCDCFEYVSELVDGFNEGELITIAARPGCGKSTIARNLIINFNEQRIKTLLISSEESEREVSSKIKKAIDEHYFMNDFNTKLFFLEDEKFDLKTIENDIKESKSKIIIIDYVQQLEGNIKQNTKALKNLAKKYKCVIFMLSQLNRGASGRMPDASMLSESDNILHGSDQVWLIHNSELHSKDGDDALLINVAKNRKGKTGIVWVLFDKEEGVIDDLEPSYWKGYNKAYKEKLSEKRYPWADQIIEALDNIHITTEKSGKPLMVLKSGIII